MSTAGTWRQRADLLHRIAAWLKDGGLVLATFGAGEPGEDVDADWLGAPMFFASLGGDAYLPLLREVGLEPLREEMVVQHEPGHGDVAFQWVLAQAWWRFARSEWSGWGRWAPASRR